MDQVNLKWTAGVIVLTLATTAVAQTNDWPFLDGAMASGETSSALYADCFPENGQSKALWCDFQQVMIRPVEDGRCSLFLNKFGVRVEPMSDGTYFGQSRPQGLCNAVNAHTLRKVGAHWEYTQIRVRRDDTPQCRFLEVNRPLTFAHGPSREIRSRCSSILP